MLTEGHIFSVKTKDPANVTDIKLGGQGIVITGLNVLRDQIKVGDFVFVVFGGDKPKDWDPGLVGLAHISSEPYTTSDDAGKNFRIEIDVDVYFQPSIKRGDLVTYPDTFDTIGIGPITKWEPNQAITAVARKNAVGLIQAICDLMPDKVKLIENILSEDWSIISRPVRRYIEASSNVGKPDEILFKEHRPDLRDEFEAWLTDGRTSVKTALENAANYIPSIDDAISEPTKQIWHGLREALYGEPSPVRIYQVSSYAELMRCFGGLDSVFDKNCDHHEFDKDRFDKCYEWANGPINHGSIRAAWRWYKKFIQWKDVQKSTSILKLISSGTQFWTYSPGRNGDKWDEVRKAGEMTLRLQGCPDFNSFADEEAIRAWFQDKEGDEASHKNNVCAAIEFRDKIKVGDYVFAKKGIKTYLGVGKVVGDYVYDETREEYRHVRKVEWIKVKTIDLEDARPATKVLTDVTPWPDFVEKIWKAYFEEKPEKPEESELPPNVDRLSIALKLFKEMRYGEEWQKNVIRDSYLSIYDFGKSTPEEFAALPIEAFKSDVMDKVWAFANGGVRKWGQLDDGEKAAYQAYVAEMRRGLKSYDAYFPPSTQCPRGLGVGVVTELLMRFYPTSCCSYNKDLIWDALVTLGLASGEYEWPKKPSIYQDFMGKCANVLRRMEDMKFGRSPRKEDKDSPDYVTVNEFFWFVHDYKDLIKEKIMASVYKPTEIKKAMQEKIDNFADFIHELETDVESAGLKYAKNLLKRFVCALLAKPFVVLTGLSGSGKTKLAEAFARWIGVENTYKIVPVGADWTNSEKLLGYPNALDSSSYVLPDTGVLNLMLDAAEHPELPFFLILDEMNLSHVERYFADFLSAMESTDGVIELYDGEKRYANGREIPQRFAFPRNLFVIGTMNVDETTYMFSPKVLDRAQVIEFRVKKGDIESFLSAPAKPNLAALDGKGAKYAEAFKTLADQRVSVPEKMDKDCKLALSGAISEMFPQLANLGSEFGYRTAYEMLSFAAYSMMATAKAKDEDKKVAIRETIDAAIVQKLLPKLHGSRRQLEKPLEALWKLSLKSDAAAEVETIAKVEGQINDFPYENNCKYAITAEKLARLFKNAKDNGFASFAEA